MSQWIDVCDIDDLQADSGICALVQGLQVAIFYQPGLQAIYAIGNYDPFSQTNVLSRGMIGDIAGEPMLASPMYKQHFYLRTGICAEDKDVSVPVYPVRIDNGRVAIKATSMRLETPLTLAAETE